MEKRKKKQSIADKVNEALQPKKLTEENDEIEAKYEEFDENFGDSNVFVSSSIRKQQAKELSELDSKYQGKVVSRKDLDLDDDDNDDIDGSEEGISFDENSDEEAVSEEEEDGSSADNESADDDDYDDFDLSQFTPKDQTKSAISEDPVILNETSEEIQKGVSVQNQLKIWEKLLEVRIKSQKMLITANSLPDYDSYISLLEHDNDSELLEKFESVCDNVTGLLDNLLELQSTLVEKFPETKDVLKGVKRKNDSNGSSSIFKRSKLAEYSDKIEDNYVNYKGYSNQVLQKWHDRTKSLKDSKNPAMNLSILNKIEGALMGKREMIRKTQIYRGDYEIFGLELPESGEIELKEIYDDSDFYHQLLRELIEYKSNVGDNQSEITQKFIELQKVRSKMKKKVETRASKGRKIRYNVHNKLVNFMPPKDDSEWNDEAKNELFSSLFGSIK